MHISLQFAPSILHSPGSSAQGAVLPTVKMDLPEVITLREFYIDILGG